MKTGHGVFDINSRPYLVHRLLWEINNGEIPINATINQICGDRGCIRPDHLVLGKPGHAKTDIKKRFWAKVAKSDDCWNWIASLDSNGYGQFVAEENGKIKHYRAHRFSWILHFGEIPKGNGYHGTCVLHKCDNPKCIRPDHLFLGSNSDNIKDMMLKGRHVSAPPTGESSPFAKLTNNQVLSIRASDKKRNELAKEYGVHHNTIANIKLGRKWRHLLAIT